MCMNQSTDEPTLCMPVSMMYNSHGPSRLFQISFFVCELYMRICDESLAQAKNFALVIPTSQPMYSTRAMTGGEPT